MNKRGGFTLLEVLISAAVGAMILTAAVACLSASISSQKQIEPRVDILQSARVSLAMMTADLRAACPLDSQYAFLGSHREVGDITADNVDFATHHYTPSRPREGDFCEMSYYLDKDSTGQFALWRRRNPVIALDPLSGGTREEIAHGLHGMKLEYTDGIEWYDTWGQINDRKTATSMKDHPNLEGMPQAVRITLLFDSDPKAKHVMEENAAPPAPPMIFRTVVFLELNGAAAVQTNSPPAPPTPDNNSGPQPGGQLQ